jgi:hypothetical protein
LFGGGLKAAATVSSGNSLRKVRKLPSKTTPLPACRPKSWMALSVLI